MNIWFMPMWEDLFREESMSSIYMRKIVIFHADMWLVKPRQWQKIIGFLFEEQCLRDLYFCFGFLSDKYYERRREREREWVNMKNISIVSDFVWQCTKRFVNHGANQGLKHNFSSKCSKCTREIKRSKFFDM